MQERRYDVDWLRVVGTLAIFLFHCSRFFDTEGWALKNADQSLVLELVRGAVTWPWVMELFFSLAGVGSWFALRRRTGEIEYTGRQRVRSNGLPLTALRPVRAARAFQGDSQAPVTLGALAA
jgi:hypothetical protein